jgi:dolichyl-phosphate-mannose-protein mannosyltransferase
VYDELMRKSLVIAPAVALLLWLAADGFKAYFSGDDGMNLHTLHGYWTKPFWQIIVSNILFFIPEYRPMGGLFYRSMYAAFGYNPLAFRVACFVLMVGNLALAFLLARRLSGSTAIAALTAFIGAYHPAFQDLYYSSGTVYDLLCFAFYAGSVLYYARVRATGDFRWKQMVLLAALNVAALNSKEMALTLPAALLSYEWLYFDRAQRRWRGIAASVAITAVFTAGKLMTTNMVTTNDAYRPVLTLERFLETTGHYYDALLCRNPRAWPLEPLLLIVAAALFAWRIRLRHLRWGLAFAFLAMVPILFIPSRSGFVLYLPYFGWALAMASLILHISRRVPPVVPFLLMAAILIPWHVKNRAWMHVGIKAFNEETRATVEQVRALHPQLPLGSILLLVNDPFPPNDWAPLFLYRLRYDDPNLWIDRTQTMESRPAKADLTLYDFIFSFHDRQVTEESAPRAGQAEERVTVQFSPERVRHGEPYVINVPGFAKQTIDVVYSMTSTNGPIGTGMVPKWCQLDGAGTARLTTPPDQPLATIRITRIRTSGGEWKLARGAITVVR